MVSLNSRLESNKEEEEVQRVAFRVLEISNQKSESRPPPAPIIKAWGLGSAFCPALHQSLIDVSYAVRRRLNRRKSWPKKPASRV